MRNNNIMYSTSYLREQLELREANRQEQEARHARLTSYKQAREKIETYKTIGKTTTAMEFTLRHAELHGMTYEGAEAFLQASGKLEAHLNEIYRR